MDTKLKRAWKTWIIELIVALVVTICLIVEPSFVSAFCCGGCFTIFVLETADLVYLLYKKDKENK